MPKLLQPSLSHSLLLVAPQFSPVSHSVPQGDTENVAKVSGMSLAFVGHVWTHSMFQHNTVRQALLRSGRNVTWCSCLDCGFWTPFFKFGRWSLLFAALLSLPYPFCHILLPRCPDMRRTIQPLPGLAIQGKDSCLVDCCASTTRTSRTDCCAPPSIGTVQHVDMYYISPRVSATMAKSGHFLATRTFSEWHLG